MVCRSRLRPTCWFPCSSWLANSSSPRTKYTSFRQSYSRFCVGPAIKTPTIDWKPPWEGGRHHYGKVFSAVVAGGGFKGGQVVGSSDAKGENVKDRPVYPVDLLGSIYQLAGIDANAKLPHPLGFDARVLDTENEGMKAAGLLEELM